MPTNDLRSLVSDPLVVRNKESGEYDRVMLDTVKNEIIFETKSLEEMAYEIDKLKVIKRFK